MNNSNLLINNNKNLSKYYSCDNIDKYVNDQNTIYDKTNNIINYGINSNMRVTGVSDGTCDQINPLIYTQHYKCGTGTAGGNPCVKSVENFISNADSYNHIASIIVLGLILILVLYSKINNISI